MKHLKTRKASDHEAFGTFLMRELCRLHIRRNDFRDVCHMSRTYLEEIKQGKGNYEVDYYEYILRAFEEFTDEEDAHRIYVEGVRLLFPGLTKKDGGQEEV